MAPYDSILLPMAPNGFKKGAVRKSTFMTSLQKDLEIAWLSRQEPLCEETILVEAEPESIHECPEEETSQDGRREINQRRW